MSIPLKHSSGFSYLKWWIKIDKKTTFGVRIIIIIIMILLNLSNISSDKVKSSENTKTAQTWLHGRIKNSNDDTKHIKKFLFMTFLLLSLITHRNIIFFYHKHEENRKINKCVEGVYDYYYYDYYF